MGRVFGRRGEQGPHQEGKAGLSFQEARPLTLKNQPVWPAKARDFGTECPPEWTVSYRRGTGGRRARAGLPLCRDPELTPPGHRVPSAISTRSMNSVLGLSQSQHLPYQSLREESGALEDAP